MGGREGLLEALAGPKVRVATALALRAVAPQAAYFLRM